MSAYQASSLLQANSPINGQEQVPKSKSMIRIENLYKKFKKNEVLKGINVNFDAPGINAILGPNGSGKTTLIKCFLGLVLPDKGNIYFYNQEVQKQFAYRNKVSHLPQIARFPENLTPLEIIRMIKDLRAGATREDYFIELFGLQKELHKKMGVLSGGNRQKVNLLLALMVLVLLVYQEEIQI